MTNTNSIMTDLKSQGHKNTKVRQAIIDILVKSKTPYSIPEILYELSELSLKPNKTTVYREIDFLKGQNILEEVDFGDGKKRYEISESHHHHIKCISCGKVKDVPESKNFKLQITNFKLFNDLGFKPISHSLEFFGLCKSCQ